MAKVTTVQKEGEEVPVEIMEQSIVDIANAMKKLNATRLKREAIVILIHHHSKVPKKTVEIVLNNLEGLESTWLKLKK